jgi:hypothetical protein
VNTSTFSISMSCGYWKAASRKGGPAARAFGYRGETFGARPARLSMYVITKPMIAK